MGQHSNQLSHTSQCLLGNLKVHVDHPANILAFYPRLLSFPTSTSPPQHTFAVPSSDLGMTCMYSAPPLKLSNSPSVRVHALSLSLSLSEVKFTWHKINHFKVWNQWPWVDSQCCAAMTYIKFQVSQPQRKSPLPISSHSSFVPCAPHYLANTNLLSVFRDLPVLHFSHKVNYTICAFWVWLFSLSIMFWGLSTL